MTAFGSGNCPAGRPGVGVSGTTAFGKHPGEKLPVRFWQPPWRAGASATGGKRTRAGAFQVANSQSVDATARIALNGRRNIDPLMTPILPNRANRLHRVRAIKQPDWNACNIWVLFAAHEHCGAAFGAEIMIEGITQLCRPGEVF